MTGVNLDMTSVSAHGNNELRLHKQHLHRFSTPVPDAMIVIGEDGIIGSLVPPPNDFLVIVRMKRSGRTSVF